MLLIKSILPREPFFKTFLKLRLPKRPDFSSFFERSAEAYLEYVAQDESMKKGGRAGVFGWLRPARYIQHEGSSIDYPS